MILGTHELVGSMETLKQPFCVLRKVVSDAARLACIRQDDEHAIVPTDSNEVFMSSSATSYQIQGVVTRKILFNKYPKVIMRAVS
jgi:hypothetical protein